METYSILWNAALTIGGAVMMFLMNRVVNNLDNLQRADKDISEEVHELKANTMTRAEVDRLMERMEGRMETYHAMHVETSKIIFAKLDLIADKMAGKIDKSDCNAKHLGDRRMYGPGEN